MVSRPPRKIHSTALIPDAAPDDLPFGRDVAQEIDFLIDLMNLNPEQAILDVASGAGSHALELARRGFGRVTAVDLSDQLLGIGGRVARTARINVDFVKGDPRQLSLAKPYDAALVIGGGAFGLMESDEENQEILDATFNALLPGGRVVLSGMSLLWLVRNANDLSGFDPFTGYLTTSETVRVEGGAVEQFPLHERYYVFPHLKRQLEAAGFRNVMGFGAAPGRFSSRSISVEDPEILLYGIKPKG